MAIIEILDHREEGWHKLTSPDLPGFFIVAPDDKIESAYADIPQAIELLYLNNKQQKVSVSLRQASDRLRQYSVEPK